MEIEPLTLTSADGTALQAELAVPDAPWGAVVLAHPHPQQGGSMRSIITSTLFERLPPLGVAALRFNFRGVERSEGTHDFGRAERDDIVAAIDTLHPVVEGLPFVLSGWSFGADTSLAVTDERLHAWVAVAPPLRTLPIEEMGAGPDPRPKVLVVPENDQFRRPDEVESMTAGWVATTVTAVPGADHYLVGRLHDAVSAVETTLREIQQG